MLSQQPQVSTPNNFPWKRIGLICLVLVALLATGIAVYSSYSLYKLKSPGYQQKLLEEQTQKITVKVGQLIELPDGVPQIATVSDVEALKKSQPFFENAKNGDQLLVYEKQAILYRPSTHKIIGVAPVNRPSAQPIPSPEINTPTAP